jgi:hypothetical protein
MGDGYVYVVGSGRSGDPVKIGWSATPQDRLKSLQTASPCELRLLDMHPGPGTLEKFLHQEFAPRRVHGEWFLLDDPIPQVAERVRAWDGGTSSPAQRQAGSVSFERVLSMLAKGSGITGDDFRVFFYCVIKTHEQGSATVNEISEHLGLTAQGTRRIAKKLVDGGALLVDDVVGRTIKCRVNPRLTGVW